MLKHDECMRDEKITILCGSTNAKENTKEIMFNAVV